MGEIKDILASAVINNTKITIEHNLPTTDLGKEKIHIQTDKFRYEVSQKEFRLIASAIISARANLNTYKD